jgi:UDP-glucose 6-dehydrogenase
MRWLASCGWRVIGYDVSEMVRAAIDEEFGHTSVATCLGDLEHCQSVHICVPTDPKPDGSADLSIVAEVVVALGQLPGIPIISQRSTCPPGTGDSMARLAPSATYGVNPSFLRKSRIEQDNRSPERVAIGGPARYVDHILEIYDGIVSPVVITESRTAIEFLKYAENAVDAVLLSLWNELLLYARTLELSSDDMTLLLDRFGDRPKFASTTRVPGKTFGLWCLPKDLRALAWELSRFDVPANTIAGAIQTNDDVAGELGEGRHGSTQLFDFDEARICLTELGRKQVRNVLG